MMDTAIPKLGHLLRALLKAAGYRGFIVSRGLDKDLDDLASEVRSSVATSLLQTIEEACSTELATECGNDWAALFRLAWFRTRESTQQLAQHADMSSFTPDRGHNLVRRYYTVPMLSGFLRICFEKHAGPEVERWWQSPFRAWVALVATKSGISEKAILSQLANSLDVDQRTIERWVSGEPMGRLAWPYSPTIRAALEKPGPEKVDQKILQFLTGWLLVAVAFQSLPLELRDEVQRHYYLRQQEPWSLGQAIARINRDGFSVGATAAREAAIPLIESVQKLFSAKPVSKKRIQDALDAFHSLFKDENQNIQNAYRYIHDWFSARLAAVGGEQEVALRLYAQAIAGTWWKAGPNQHPFLKEALLYAVGVGDKIAAENYWDKIFMLGLNGGPKRLLDDQEIRRLSFAFEKVFYPQKAKARIPPPVEILIQDSEFTVDRKQLSRPNQKVKFANGRTRRTPLMQAILEGTLNDVRRLVDAGGDPNDYISESGEGPLTFAMRRACDRKDTAIMDYLLEFDLLAETVNRRASTKRETPLKIAIEMANARAVTRLIELGADVEQPCDYLPSALCYAMVLFHGSLHRDDMTQEWAYFSGKTLADVHDAKHGAVLDVDLATRRHHLLALRESTARNQQIWQEVEEYFTRPADDHRQVIQALMQGGADANRRYRVEPYHFAEWTPTLFAAQVGDLDVFRLLVEHPGPKRGNPLLTLMSPSSLERFDALWVAVDHGRHAIVSYLLDHAGR